jgi:hypothetical protein
VFSSPERFVLFTKKWRRTRANTNERRKKKIALNKHKYENQTPNMKKPRFIKHGSIKHVTCGAKSNLDL